MAKKQKKTKPASNDVTQKGALTLRDPLTGQLVTSDTVNAGFFNSRLSPNNSYGNGQYEVEASNSQIILTTRFDNWIGANAPKPERFDVRRLVLTGSFSTDKGGYLQGTVTRASAFNVQSEDGFFMETAQSYEAKKGTRISGDLMFSPQSIDSAKYYYSNLDANTYDSNGTIIGNTFDSEGRYPNTPLYDQRSSLRGLPDVSFFADGWWQNPFGLSLI